MNKKLVVANWKMNPTTLKAAERLFKNVANKVAETKNMNVIICSPFVYLSALKKLSFGHSQTGEARKISLGAQNAFSTGEGPYTGEVSPEMLYDVGARYVILGHSKRREFGETSEEVSKKVRAATAAGLTVILCVGESARDESHDYFKFVQRQVLESLAGISKNLLPKIIVVYEPVWSISTTPNHKDATPDDCREMVLFIKKILVDKFGKVKMPRILYGGDVNDRNVAIFLEQDNIDGVLVGAASLNEKKFKEIIRIAESLK